MRDKIIERRIFLIPRRKHIVVMVAIIMLNKEGNKI